MCVRVAVEALTGRSGAEVGVSQQSCLSWRVAQTILRFNVVRRHAVALCVVGVRRVRSCGLEGRTVLSLSIRSHDTAGGVLSLKQVIRSPANEARMGTAPVETALSSLSRHTAVSQVPLKPSTLHYLE